MFRTQAKESDEHMAHTTLLGLTSSGACAVVAETYEVTDWPTVTDRRSFLDSVGPDEILLDDEDPDVVAWAQSNNVPLVHRRDHEGVTPRTMVARYIRQRLNLPLPRVLAEEC